MWVELGSLGATLWGDGRGRWGRWITGTPVIHGPRLTAASSPQSCAQTGQRPPAFGEADYPHIPVASPNLCARAHGAQSAPGILYFFFRAGAANYFAQQSIVSTLSLAFGNRQSQTAADLPPCRQNLQSSESPN